MNSVRIYGDETNDNDRHWSQALETHGSLDAYLEYYHQAKTGAPQKRKTDVHPVTHELVVRNSSHRSSPALCSIRLHP